MLILGNPEFFAQPKVLKHKIIHIYFMCGVWYTNILLAGAADMVKKRHTAARRTKLVQQSNAH